MFFILFIVPDHRTPPFYVDPQFSIANLGKALKPVLHTAEAEPN